MRAFANKSTKGILCDTRSEGSTQVAVNMMNKWKKTQLLSAHYMQSAVPGTKDNNKEDRPFSQEADILMGENSTGGRGCSPCRGCF